MAGDDPLLDALRKLTGRADASFRDGQREAISALVDDRSRVLVVQRTGWGKSAVYFLTTRLLREQGFGPTLLISPLLALMRNQIEAATRLGLRCETINSASATTVHELERRLHDDDVDLILISPERLANPQFADKIMPLVGERPGLIVIDEVHCISDWGHDFRPDYRRIGRLLDKLAGTSVPILGCTATANDRVVADVAVQLGAELTTFRGPLRRDGLALSAHALDRPAERLAWLAETVPTLEGSGIIYCLTVRDVDNVTDWLRSQGLDVEAYHGGLPNEERLAAEGKLQRNEIKALVATTALGMGYDKPDLGFVVHFQSPGSPVAYYQQVGRAGRALDRSDGILLRGLEDVAIQDYFIENAFAAEHLVNDLVAAYDRFDEPASLIRAQQYVNVSIGRLEMVAKQLDVEGVLERVEGSKYVRTSEPWAYPAERINAVTAARRREQQSMLDYFHTDGCRMRHIADLLDDPDATDCGICDNCTGDRASGNATIDLPTELVAEAERFLRKRPIELTTKKQVYDPATGSRRNFPNAERAEDGRVLAIWGDAGWGQLVRQGKLDDGAFDERLVDAFVEMVEEWAPDPAPSWVTCVPSLRYPKLVPDFAAAVAARLGLPFETVVAKVEERPPQFEQQNSVHQQLNIEGAFAVEGTVPGGAVLLVDDIVDSSWTMTDIARRLRRAGSGPVLPAALASSSKRES
ncbi:MAG: ATP-dependent DNA helicase RecG [Acidimicrobiaceae bacterium]|nr:ATP-dependent DNA helicase RecG [Acidimicrobiaceae bacterium]